jgi:FixJ family two-component response regulator
MRSEVHIDHRGAESSAYADVPVIYIVDDQASYRAAMARMLRAAGYKVVPFEAADRLLEVLPPPVRGCILLDVKMPGLSGPELQERLLQLGYELPVIFMSGHGDIPTAVRTIKAGAEDFLAKPAPIDVVLGTIERALQRYDERQVRGSKLRQLRGRLDALTPREREVFGLVVRGMLNKQIAFKLGTSERTIKAHRHSIMSKLNVRSVAELVSMAERLGLVAGDPAA